MSEQPTTIEAPKRRGPLVAGVVVAAVVVIALVAFFLTRGDDATSAAGEDAETVSIGVVGASDPYWEVFVDAAAEEGIDVELRDFTDYTQPNPAVSAGELDLNQFQHLVYLADYNLANDADLTPVGSTAVYPLGLYSSQHDAVGDIPDGGTVAVPDDVSNQARALGILAKNGLIELDGEPSIFTDLSDVDTGASRVKVEALAADVTATSLEDLDAAVINNDFVEKAGLSFDDALATDDAADPTAEPYVNVFVARAEDADNPTYERLVEIFQDTKAVTDGLQEVSGGTAQLVKAPRSELVDVYERAEAETKANQS
ncbi:MAG: methionine ABC transporter substrate-binding protein [Actinomycetales bacterium]|nr:MAG: methionine ABC transporter substrate-binding protein [Actinomycetales bacterium]